MKRLCLLLLVVLLPLGAMGEEPALTAEELAEIAALDAVEDVTDEDSGPVWEEPALADFPPDAPAVYTCKVLEDSSLFAGRSLESARLLRKAGGQKAEVLYVGSEWAIVRVDGVTGYILRRRIYGVKPVDPVHTPPYGVQKSAYIARTAAACPVRRAMSGEAEAFVTLEEGTLISVWRFQEGWAIVPYWHTYGYIDARLLTELIPVSPTDAPLRGDTPIAAYTSYYSMKQSRSNLNRINNIAVACRRMSRTLAPGEELDFNRDAGPYNAAAGNKKAPVLSNGETIPGYGGGTCQASSTLYNAMLQLPGVEILQRRPHGPYGASYLAHGMDAAVGNDEQNLRLRNGYDFPLRIEAFSEGDGALTVCVYTGDSPRTGCSGKERTASSMSKIL